MENSWCEFFILFVALLEHPTSFDSLFEETIQQLWPFVSDIRCMKMFGSEPLTENGDGKRIMDFISLVVGIPQVRYNMVTTILIFLTLWTNMIF